VEGIILGRASGENQTSLKRWLESREVHTRPHRAAKSKSSRQSPRTGRRASRGI
jgi:hypothetical protein